MLPRYRAFHYAWMGILVCLILGSAPNLHAIFHRKSKAEKREKKERKLVKKEEKKEVKQGKQYRNISEYAQDLYESDPDFREQVHKAYQELQQQQAMKAYQVNTSKRVALVRTEGDALGLEKVLYDDPRVQDYVDRVGQSLVPENSGKLYAFRIIQSPVPGANSLSTGTIYVTTGLISLTDNEAQLAYILSHEIAHVDKDHWKTKVMIEQAVPRWEAHLVKKRAVTGALLGAGLGAAIGGAVGQSVAAAGKGVGAGALLGLTAGMFTSSIEAARMDMVDWTLPQEDEADAFALKNALAHDYDVSEVPKLYATLKSAFLADSRVGLGFVADGRRIDTRMKYVTDQLATTYQTEYSEKLKKEELVGTSPDYELMMAELKRDNGILALRFDMLDMARKNLHQAVQLRSDDAVALFYEGKIDKLTARTADERQQAATETTRAIKLDETRHMLPEADLQEALLLMDKTDRGSQAEAAKALKDYILGYEERQVADWKYFNALPPNMVILYDYLRLLGEPNWKPQFPELQRALTAEYGTGDTTAPLVSTAGVDARRVAARAPESRSSSPRR